MEIFKRAVKVRKAAQRGKEITLPPQVPLKPGDEVIQLYDGFVLIVPKGTVVNEVLLMKAIRVEAKRGGKAPNTR